jgi:hypothetical protein
MPRESSLLGAFIDSTPNINLLHTLGSLPSDDSNIRRVNGLLDAIQEGLRSFVRASIERFSRSTMATPMGNMCEDYLIEIGVIMGTPFPFVSKPPTSCRLNCQRIPATECGRAGLFGPLWMNFWVEATRRHYWTVWLVAGKPMGIAF